MVGVVLCRAVHFVGAMIATVKRGRRAAQGSSLGRIARPSASRGGPAAVGPSVPFVSAVYFLRFGPSSSGRRRGASLFLSSAGQPTARDRLARPFSTARDRQSLTRRAATLTRHVRAVCSLTRQGKE